MYSGVPTGAMSGSAEVAVEAVDVDADPTADADPTVDAAPTADAGVPDPSDEVGWTGASSVPNTEPRSPITTRQ